MFVSCKHETIDLYELDDAKIYFQVQSYSSANGAVGYSNSTDYSFVGVNQNVDGLTFKATIQMMGQVVDYDRECKITIDADSTTMVEGVDYEIDLDTLKIKAGQSKATFGVRFLRSQNIKVSGSDIGPHGGLQLGELGLCLLARFFGRLSACRTLSTQFYGKIELPALRTCFGACVLQRVGKLGIGA